MLGIEPRAARYTWTAALVLLLLGAIYLIRDVLLVFIVALLFAYLLYPLVDLLDRHMPSRTRTFALALTYLLTIGIIVTFGVFIGSAAADQAANLAKSAPAFLERIREAPTPGPGSVRSFKDQLTDVVQSQLRAHYNEIVSVVPRWSLRVLAASGNLLYVIVVPILSFFILRDGRRIRDGFLEMFGVARAGAEETLVDIHTLLLQYMRALLFLLRRHVRGIQYRAERHGRALRFAARLDRFSARIHSARRATLGGRHHPGCRHTQRGYPHVLWLVIFLGIYRIFQDYVISPNLMSRGVELHPMLVIFGVLAGGEIGGVAGIFLSIPTLALIRLFYHRIARTRTAERALRSG